LHRNPSPSINVPQTQKLDNKRSVKSSITRNSFVVVPTPKDSDTADKAARGLTSPKLWYDEMAFIKYIELVYPIASPIQNKAKEAAIRNNVPYGSVMTTTPNYLDSPEGEFVYNLMLNGCKWNEEMYDWNRKKISDYLYENSLNDVIYIKYNWRELGKDDKWYESQCRQMQDRQKVKREIDLEWTFASDNSPFSEEELEILKESLLPSISTKIFNDLYTFEIYELIDPSLPYLLGIDVGGGLLQDSSSIVGVNPYTEKTAFIFKNNRISTERFKLLIFDVMTTWLFASVAIIERNSYGLAIIQSLLEDPKFASIKSRLFYFLKEQERKIKYGEKEERMSKLRVKKEKVKVFGVNTSPESRKIYFDFLGDIVRHNPEKIVSERIFSQIKTLEIKKNGKIEHRQGFHDDLVLGRMFPEFSKTQTTYGIFIRRLTKEEENAFVNNYLSRLGATRNINDFSPLSQKLIQSELATKKEGNNSLIEKIHQLNKGDR
jgi:hypothetical protein